MEMARRRIASTVRQDAVDRDESDHEIGVKKRGGQ